MENPLVLRLIEQELRAHQWPIISLFRPEFHVYSALPYPTQFEFQPAYPVPTVPTAWLQPADLLLPSTIESQAAMITVEEPIETVHNNTPVNNTPVTSPKPASQLLSNDAQGEIITTKRPDASDEQFSDDAAFLLALKASLTNGKTNSSVQGNAESESDSELLRSAEKALAIQQSAIQSLKRKLQETSELANKPSTSKEPVINIDESSTDEELAAFYRKRNDEENEKRKRINPFLQDSPRSSDGSDEGASLKDFIDDGETDSDDKQPKKQSRLCQPSVSRRNISKSRKQPQKK